MGETRRQGERGSVLQPGPSRRPPRHQWRAWGLAGELRAELQRLGTEHRIENRRDVYLVGAPTELSVKLRENRLEINRLVGETAGFEQWSRAVAHPLPSDAAALRAVLDELAVHDDPPPLQARLGPRKLLRAAEQRGLSPVVTLKQRSRVRIGSLRAEATTVRLAELGVQLDCVTIEGRRLDELQELHTRLGLQHTVNQSMPAALAALLSGGRSAGHGGRDARNAPNVGR